LSRWWQAALNEASGESFTLSFTAGVVLVFRVWPARPGTRLTP